VLASALKRLVARLRPGSLERGDRTDAPRRSVENTDALTAARDQHFDPFGSHGGAPPNYVPPADEGRPRH
jgi:hypothetical protein